MMQMALSALAGCAAMQRVNTEVQNTYQVSVTTPANYVDQLHSLLAEVPAVLLTDSHHHVLPSNHPYKTLELKMQGKNSIEQLKRSIQSSGIPLAGLQIREVSL